MLASARRGIHDSARWPFEMIRYMTRTKGLLPKLTCRPRTFSGYASFLKTGDSDPRCPAELLESLSTSKADGVLHPLTLRDVRRGMPARRRGGPQHAAGHSPKMEPRGVPGPRPGDVQVTAPDREISSQGSRSSGCWRRALTRQTTALWRDSFRPRRDLGNKTVNGP